MKESLSLNTEKRVFYLPSYFGEDVVLTFNTGKPLYYASAENKIWHPIGTIKSSLDCSSVNSCNEKQFELDIINVSDPKNSLRYFLDKFGNVIRQINIDLHPASYISQILANEWGDVTLLATFQHWIKANDIDSLKDVYSWLSTESSHRYCIARKLLRLILSSMLGIDHDSKSQFIDLGCTENELGLLDCDTYFEYVEQIARCAINLSSPDLDWKEVFSFLDSLSGSAYASLAMLMLKVEASSINKDLEYARKAMNVPDSVFAEFLKRWQSLKYADLLVHYDNIDEALDIIEKSIKLQFENNLSTYNHIKHYTQIAKCCEKEKALIIKKLRTECLDAQHNVALLVALAATYDIKLLSDDQIGFIRNQLTKAFNSYSWAVDPFYQEMLEELRVEASSCDNLEDHKEALLSYYDRDLDFLQSVNVNISPRTQSEVAKPSIAITVSGFVRVYSKLKDLSHIADMLSSRYDVYIFLCLFDRLGDIYVPSCVPSKYFSYHHGGFYAEINKTKPVNMVTLRHFMPSANILLSKRLPDDYYLTNIGIKHPQWLMVFNAFKFAQHWLSANSVNPDYAVRIRLDNLPQDKAAIARGIDELKLWILTRF